VEGERQPLENQESQGPATFPSGQVPSLGRFSGTLSTGWSGRLGYANETSWNSTIPCSVGGARVPGSGRLGFLSRKESSPPLVTSPARICCSPQLSTSTCTPKVSTSRSRSRCHHNCRHRSTAFL
uniref:Uncharacterized protein n=1 Tax=Ictidomys tridecemlineatus TaxID=43179 RepID=A0A287CXV2_ICTTR